MAPGCGALAVLLALAACTPEPPGPEVRPLAAAAAGGGPSPADGGAPMGPAPLPILSAEVVLSESFAAPMARDGLTVVPQTARFRVEVAARLVDGRLSLLDAQDAMVAADGTREVGATTRFTLTPISPLRPGSSYRLRLEGAEGPLPHGGDGRAYQPASLALRAAGDPPPPRRGRRRR